MENTGNCTLKNEKNKIGRLIKALDRIDVKAKIESDTVVITVGKRRDGTGSFYKPFRNTAKMKSGIIISKKGRVNLFLRKFWAKLGIDNQVIARPIQELSGC